MTREKAIEQELKTRHETPHYNAGFVEGAKWADKHPHWISVEERLPEEGIYVATLDNGGRNDIRHFYNGKWFGRFGKEYRGITHWMPLPAPPSCSEFPNYHKKGGEKLDADKVIAWLVANIVDFEYYVKRFKEDFKL